MSVFLEGRKKARRSGGGEGGEGGGEEDGEDERGSRDREEEGRKSKSVPGGKGMGGRWLFVSHDAVDVPGVGEGEPLTALFGLTRMGKERGSVDRSERPHARYVKFAFEPMVRYPHASAAVNPLVVGTFPVGVDFVYSSRLIGICVSRIRFSISPPLPSLTPPPSSALLSPPAFAKAASNRSRT